MRATCHHRKTTRVNKPKRDSNIKENDSKTMEGARVAERCAYGFEEVGVGGGVGGRGGVPGCGGEGAEVEVVAAIAGGELRRSHGRRLRRTSEFTDGDV